MGGTNTPKSFEDLAKEEGTTPEAIAEQVKTPEEIVKEVITEEQGSPTPTEKKE